MSVFVDTNVLLRAADPGDPKHEAATRTISELLEAGSLSGISCVGHNMRSVNAQKTEITHV